MIRGRAIIPGVDFEAFSKILRSAPEWLRAAQEQLVSLPPLIHYDDLEASLFPEADESTLLYLPFDLFIKDVEWRSLRGGRDYSVGDALPSSFEPIPPIDYTAQPVGTIRLLYNGTGSTILSGETVGASGLSNIRIQASGSAVDIGVAVPPGSQWYSFVKISSGEAGEFVRVA